MQRAYVVIRSGRRGLAVTERLSAKAMTLQNDMASACMLEQVEIAVYYRREPDEEPTECSLSSQKPRISPGRSLAKRADPGSTPLFLPVLGDETLHMAFPSNAFRTRMVCQPSNNRRASAKNRPPGWLKEE